MRSTFLIFFIKGYINFLIIILHYIFCIQVSFFIIKIDLQKNRKGNKEFNCFNLSEAFEIYYILTILKV